ncbi:activating transcription factor 7-interacting protein 2 [Nymphalis io]|uniref:activating transcription factor 7-interacting protein 2 n=1 Tax=Inachis io TaxID=171585 RepID=UPI002169EEFF|nr:activating transcription factor 7-interacting protein 2 [Nymphalis io]XP_050351692.1 activating transcription factor 7-interacting protein 2 [Nymphalis io]
MQLILNTETDIDIHRKMSAIKQESFDEKFINKTLAEQVNDEIPNINEDSVKESLVEELNENENFKTNEDTANDVENISSKCLTETTSNDCLENTCVTDLPEECNEQKENNNITNIIIEDEELDNSDIVIEKHNKEKETELQLSENENNNMDGKTQEEQEKIITDNIENTVEEVDVILEETNDKLDKQVLIKTEPEDNKEIIDDSVLNGEVISISDDKEGECITLSEQEVSGEEVKPETSSNDVSKNITIQPTDNDTDDDQKRHDGNTQDIVNDEPGLTIDSSSVKSITENIEVNQSEEMLKDTNVSNDNSNVAVMQQVKIENKNTNNSIKDTNKFSHICKLSNTLDILSDEEEESIEKESQNKLPSSDGKQCINIEDDDDIMLIDEETNVKDEKNNSSNVVETKIDVKETGETPKNDLLDTEAIENKETLNVNQDNAVISKTDLNETKEEQKLVENKPIQKPLLPVNFLKTCKKNLADMTRDELEEFCILKIVESVVDRSNLSEIKMKLKTLGQNIEEYKRKAMLLTKQNRDLQVVLKSVQEEQKKKSDVPITPLKITRSVGMQVFMTDKVAVRKKSVLTNTVQNNVTCNNTTNRIKNQLNQSPKPIKTQTNPNNTQQIPVPRLVPAVNNASNNKLQSSVTINSTKSPVTTTLPNGIRNSPPTLKPEKRTHSKMQQGNSVTVDLTDDEPPTKVLQRIVNPPVRLVSPQNLLAPQRQPFGTNISSPRKVYIPISGSQNQVRPGQTIMLRPIAPQGPRHRMPNILPKPNSNTNAVRMTRITRHPAPLPDSMKQYQPPNWKALPPAPELKLSKVDNGIVISWKIDGYKEENQEEIASYQLYAYQETSSPPSTALWKKIGDVKALPLPMACTLTQFMAGYKYYFAVRAVDIRSRLGPFSSPGSILLLNKM